MHLTNDDPTASSFYGSSENGLKDHQHVRESFFNLNTSHEQNVPNLSIKKNQNCRAYEEIRKKFFIPEVCRYGHKAYMQSATIYETMKMEHNSEQVINFSSENEKRLAFQLVFQSLKYESFLHGMLEKSLFFDKFPELTEKKAQVLMVVCDYIERRFQKRASSSNEVDELTKIETCIIKHKTKLNASLARCRISSNFLSLDSFLPETVRENDKIASQMFLSSWVNQIKISDLFVSSIEEMKKLLKEEGFTEVEREDGMVGKSFMIDRHCHDLLFFPNELLQYLDEANFMKNKLLISQDKSSCIAQHCIRSLTGEADDILFVNVGAAISLGHLSSLLLGNNSTLHAIGISSNKQLKQCELNLNAMGIDTGQVKLISGSVTELDTNVEPYKNIKLIIFMANCTRNGVVNPSHFIVSEGEDYNFQTYSRMLNNLSSGMVGGERISQSKELNLTALKHCLQFPKLQSLVYCTRTLNHEEDEDVVKEAIDFYNDNYPTKIPYSSAPPGLPLDEDDIWNENPLQGKFLKFFPSRTSSGCFIACISREAEDPQAMVREILAKAAARGIPVDVKNSKNG